MSNYIIGSGWWCGNDTRENLFGDDEIRSLDFHEKWYQSIIDNTNPDKIVIVDSASPVKPKLNKNDDRLEFLSLNNNAGHSTNLRDGFRFCGWTASVLLTLQYTELCDTDYFVYVEQDVLLKGNGIIENVIKHMEDNNLDYIFGSPGSTSQPLQQSFFIIKKAFIPYFIRNIKKIPFDDSIIGPEYKFAIAVSGLSKIIPSFLFMNRYFRFLYRKLIKVNYMNIGYGRQRPINFEDDFFYFQHATREELVKYESNRT